MKKRKINLIKPKPFDLVELKFDIVGEVPKNWLTHGYGIGISWMGESGNYLPMSGPTAEIIPSLLSTLKKRIKFISHVELTSSDPEHPHGIIFDIRSDQYDNYSLFPFIVKGTNKNYDNEIKNLKKKLLNSINKIIRLKNDWKIYRSELEKISKQKVWDKKLSEDIFNILNTSEEFFLPIIETDEERKEIELAERYKEANMWEGPLLGGRVGSMEGFDFRVYSLDHNPKHFHIIHKGRGIEARFSFPQIELINYLGHSNSIGSKEISKIKEYFELPENFKRLKSDFEKQLSQ